MKLVERGGGSRKRGGLCTHFLSVGVAFWQQPNGNAKKSTVAAGKKQLQKSNEKQFATKVMRSEMNKSHQRNVHKCSKVQIDIKVGHEI